MNVSIEELRKENKKKMETVKWAHHPCGMGSVYENTELTRTLLKTIVEQYDIKTVSDAGAGDLSWVKTIDWDVDYTGYDIRQWHPDVVLCDVTKDVLPKTDLIICRHVLNHLHGKLAMEAWKRFEESGSKYIFITCTDNGVKRYTERWGEPIVIGQEEFGGGRVWNYGLWQLTSSDS